MPSFSEAQLINRLRTKSICPDGMCPSSCRFIPDKANRQTKQEYGSECKVSPAFRFHHSTRVSYRADTRSVIDPSRRLDGTPEMDLDSRRRKSVRLVQRLKGFVRLVYLICGSLLLLEIDFRYEGWALMSREFGLPVQVRDAALGRKNTAPTSDINKRESSSNPSSTMNRLIFRISYPEFRKTGRLMKVWHRYRELTIRWKIHQME